MQKFFSIVSLVLALFVLSSCSGNRFAQYSVWVGRYECSQGWTDLELEVTKVQDENIEALFNFEHVPSGAAGSFYLSGTFDPESREVNFMPGEWKIRPYCYSTVGMAGKVLDHPTRFEGRITHDKCGSFKVVPKLSAPSD